MGSEFRKKGVNVFLGPVVSPLGRTVSSGRNWEGSYSPIFQRYAELPADAPFRNLFRPLPIGCSRLRDCLRSSKCGRDYEHEGKKGLYALYTGLPSNQLHSISSPMSKKATACLMRLLNLYPRTLMTKQCMSYISGRFRMLYTPEVQI